MKAIIRGSFGLLSLLLLASVSHGWYYASAVFKTPLPTAPDCFNPGYYMQGPCGMWYGPNYYLMPPCQPFNGMLPGPTGQAIMSGFLPHTQLLSKDGLAIGRVPMLGQKSSAGEPESPYPNPGAGLPAVGNSATPMQTPYGMPMNSPYAGLPPRPPYSGMPWSGPIPNGVMLPPLPNGGMPQMPYGAVPYGGQMPYGAPQMPYGAAPQMPYGCARPADAVSAALSAAGAAAGESVSAGGVCAVSRPDGGDVCAGVARPGNGDLAGTEHGARSDRSIPGFNPQTPDVADDAERARRCRGCLRGRRFPMGRMDRKASSSSGRCSNSDSSMRSRARRCRSSRAWTWYRCKRRAWRCKARRRINGSTRFRRIRSCAARATSSCGALCGRKNANAAAGRIRCREHGQRPFVAPRGARSAWERGFLEGLNSLANRADKCHNPITRCCAACN